MLAFVPGLSQEPVPRPPVCRARQRLGSSSCHNLTWRYVSLSTEIRSFRRRLNQADGWKANARQRGARSANATRAAEDSFRSDGRPAVKWKVLGKDWVSQV